MFNCYNGELMKTLAEHPDIEILNLTVVRTKEMSMIVSIGSNNVIQIHEDDNLHGTSAVRRTINISNYEIQVARVYTAQSNNAKYLIVGLNKGMIKVYELETGRPDASYPAYQEFSVLDPQGESSLIVDILALKTKPFFFTTDNSGFFTLWIAPPSLKKY